MRMDEYLDALGQHGAVIGETVERVGFDAEVPSCPGWQVRDLVGHTGGIHRWAAAILTAEPGSGRVAVPDAPADALLDWYRDGLARLLELLTAAPDDLQAFTFMPTPHGAKVFWGRRQAHETAIHRADADLAQGVPTSYPAEFAADGIDELLNGFLARPRSRLLADPAATLLIAPTDADTWWHLTINPDGRVVRSTGDQAADATLRGTASDLYLHLWNRASLRPVHAEGDERVLDQWRALTAV